MRHTRTAFLGMILAITALFAGCTSSMKFAGEAAVTLIVVRYGDRDSSLVDELNKIARARAEALVAALSGM